MATIGLHSLRARLLLAASCVLIIFIILCGAGLEQAFVQSALQSQRNRMQGLVYALLGAAEPGPQGTLKIAAAALPDPRLAHIDSGLEAIIFNRHGDAVWRSPSLSGSLPKVVAPPVGVSLLRQEGRNFVFSFGIRWLDASKKSRRYTISLIEGQSNYQKQLYAFRRTLWISLGTAAVMLILVQFFLLRWGLSPLRHLAREISDVEAGHRSRIEGTYPLELMPLATNLNAMIGNERNQLTRYRNALGDLAHSLKTPLAVMRGIYDDLEVPELYRQQMKDPLERMEDIADYQLRRAATANRRILSEPLLLRPLADKTIGALSKVYADRAITFEDDIDDRLRVRADQNDLYEILGNLLDNACKWAETKIRIRAVTGNETLLEVEDDGPGFPADSNTLLSRGVRADTRTAGQGIGLATVADIVRLNEGRIELDTSPDLGGARIRIYWPR